MTQTSAGKGPRRFGLKRARGLSALVLVVGGLGLWSCGDDAHPPVQASLLPPPPDGSGGESSLGGMGGGAGSGNVDGTGGTDPVGTGGAAPMTVCGDLFLEPIEECEEGRFRDETCESRGFEAGELRCDESCVIQTDDCSGVEDCFDGEDNDGDGLADCLDPVDCSSVCGDACEGPTASFGSLAINGTTAGRGNVFDSSCSDSESGAEVVYEVTAGEDGKLDVNLITSAALNLSVTTSCGDPESELACGSARRFSIDAFEGEVFFVTVEGNEAADVGAYFLEVRSRVPGCADGVLDPDEECDDFNTLDGDGCDEECFLEADESEPNGEFLSANEVSGDRFVAAINPANDTDVFAVTTTEASSTIVVGTSHLGDGACSYNIMDTQIEVLGTEGDAYELLVLDDDSGDGLCSLAVAPGLAAGTYYIRVKAAPGATPAVFPYVLEVEVGVCGDGDQSPGEECDDGNSEDDDGCSSDCEAEF